MGVIPGTRFLILSIAFATAFLPAASGSDDKPSFQAGKAADYAHQSVEQVLIGAKAFDTADLTAGPFGPKIDFLRFGVLPVLVVIENKRDRAINLQNLEDSLVGSDGRHVMAVNPEELQLIAGDGKRRPKQPGTGLPIPLPAKKNPLARPEIEARAFVVKMLPPGESASGFFYFEAMTEAGDSLYVSGLKDARSNKDIMYFEFPLKDGKN